MSLSRVLLTLFVAFGVALVPTAFAATTAAASADATVVAVNSLAITAGSALTFAPTVAVPAQDSSTELSFETNDGSTYRITVVADAGWVFTPSVALQAANTYPVLRFVSATSSAGTASVTPGELISSANVVGSAVDVVTAITNVSGTATAVTLEASITQTVVSGGYSTSLTYSLITP